MPIGLPVETVGFPRVGLNCGLCHIGSVRADAAAPQRIVLGAPNSTLDLQRYFRSCSPRRATSVSDRTC